MGELEDVVMEGDVDEGEEARSLRRRDFKVEANAFYYMQVPGIYYSDLQVMRLKHMSVAECAIPF